MKLASFKELVKNCFTNLQVLRGVSTSQLHQPFDKGCPRLTFMNNFLLWKVDNPLKNWPNWSKIVFMLVTTKSSYCFKNFYEGGKSQSCLEFCAQFCHPNLHVTLVCEKESKNYMSSFDDFLKKLTIFKIDFQTFFSLISEVEFITDYTVFWDYRKTTV